jgi:hypothetical protein
VFLEGSGENFNNVTSTKDTVNATTDILIAAKEDVDDKAYYKLLSIPPPVTHEETQTGGSSSSSTVTTGASLTAVSDHLYLAAIATKPYKTVSSVSGLGLTWTLVQAQCSKRNQTGVTVFQALGTPTGNGTVTATLASAPLNAVIAVSRYSGVDAADPIGAVASRNTNEDGTCPGGSDTSSDTDNYSLDLDLPTVTYGGKVYGAVAMRYRGHDPVTGTGFEELTSDVYQGSTNGDKAGLAVMEAPEEADPTTVAGTLTGAADWAVIAIEILPQQ